MDFLSTGGRAPSAGSNGNAPTLGVNRAASGKLFTPLAVANCVLWCAADTLVNNDGDAIGRWADKSGQGNDLVQATSAKQPIYKTSIINGKPVLRFTQTNSTMLQVSFTLSQPTTVFIVFANTGIQAQYYYFDGGLGDHMVGFDSQVFAHSFRMYAGAYGPDAGANTIPLNSWQLVTAGYNGASSFLNVNGTAKNAGGSTNAGSSAPSGFTLGANASGSIYANEDVAEVLIYSAVLSASDQKNVETYLCGRYGFTWGS